MPSRELFPWMPASPFLVDNHQTIEAIFRQIREDFPDPAQPNLEELTAESPSPEAMSWMWQRLMGRQHGSQEGFDGKIPLTSDREDPYWPHVNRLHYGSHGFMRPSPVPLGDAFDKAHIAGGMPHEMTAILGEVVGHQPQQGNIQDIVVMAGQRLRWNIPAEKDTSSIYAATARYTITDIDSLRQKSPWLRAEEGRPYIDEWNRPFATEFELARLAVEAVLEPVIDWKQYDVTITPDSMPHEEQYEFRGEVRVIPPRENAVYTYNLTNGTRAHILNGKAVPRAQGVPRPNCDSQTREIVDFLYDERNAGDRIVLGTGQPHIRGALDTIIRLLALGRNISKANIVMPQWLHDKELLAALGEIPATHKADLRLRAALNGENPDADHFVNL